MDPHFVVTREEFHNVQTDLKQVQYVQSSHADRLLRLEKRQADDAALKSVWNSPFPGVLSGTPQHGPVHMSSNEEVFDDLDNQGQNLLGSLHLEADDEPIRRGAASRANSVRFDESALQGSNWGAQSGRHSGEFGPTRPSSGLGNHALMERSLSHKSDGRHSSAGHSVHSMHSGISGRASSLGLDTNFIIGGRDEDSPLGIPEPPPGFFILGSVPSIIRCWLNIDFSSSTLLYAAVCTGAQTSSVEFSLVKELGQANEIQKDADGLYRIRLPVYLAEARVIQSNSRSPSLAPQLPSIHTWFDVTGVENTAPADSRRIRVFIGSDTLRTHSADILFSQNLMTLYGNDRDKLSVPFVRPEDDTSFKHLATSHVIPERPKLNATAPEFVSAENLSRSEQQTSEPPSSASPLKRALDSQDVLSPTVDPPGPPSSKPATAPSTASESGPESERQAANSASGETGHVGSSRRDSSAAIWGPWRQGVSGSGSDTAPRENGLLSGYQPAVRSSRGMKVLKASSKSTSNSSSARTGASYEPPPPPRSSGEHRRKNQTANPTTSTPANSTTAAGAATEATGGGVLASLATRRDAKRSFSGTLGGGGAGSRSQSASYDAGKGSSAPRSANNPLGNASAFASWMSQASKSKASTTAAE